TKERLERRIRSAQPPDPLPPSCPEPLRRIIFKMLARDPERRYQTALEVNEDLARFQNGQQVRAEPFRPSQALDSNATVRTTPPVQQRATDDRTVRSGSGVPLLTRKRRSSRALGCLAAFGVACLIVFTFVSVQL